jgi:hypothetical protein
MATPGYAPQAVRIDIHVNHADAASGRTGTFSGPAPLVRVKSGDTVEWRITPPSDQFQVSFPGLSPFNGAPNPITNGTGVLTAQNIGNYHYQVSVSDGTNTWVISNCPELNVGN